MRTSMRTVFHCPAVPGEGGRVPYLVSFIFTQMANRLERRASFAGAMQGLRQVSAALDPPLALAATDADPPPPTEEPPEDQPRLRQASTADRRRLAMRLRQASKVGRVSDSDSDTESESEPVDDDDDATTATTAAADEAEEIDDAYNAEYSISLASRFGIFAFTVADTCCRSFLKTLGDHPQLTMTTVLALCHSWTKDPLTGTLSCCKTGDAGGAPWKGALGTAMSMGVYGLFQGFHYHLAGNLIQDLSTMGGHGFPAFLYSSFSSDSASAWFLTLSKVLGKLVAIIPVAMNQVYFLRSFVCNDSSGSRSSELSNNASAAGALLGIVPMWVLANQAMWALLPRSGTWGSFSWSRPGKPENFATACTTIYHLGHYLPCGHRLREWRSLRQLIDKTPWYLQKLFVAPFLTGFPSPDISWTEWWHAMILQVPVMGLGVAIGKVIKYPCTILYARIRQSFVESMFETKEQHLARKLQHASEHYDEVRAKIAGSKELTSVSGPASQQNRSAQGPPRGLVRTSTIVMKQAAVKEGLNEKHRALGYRIYEHAKLIHATSQPGTAARQFLQVTREALHVSVQLLGYGEPLALALGQLKIQFRGEAGVDMGGLLRAWMEAICAEMLLPVDHPFDAVTGKGYLCRLLQPGPDAGLLPMAMDSGFSSAAKARQRKILFGFGRLMALAITSAVPLSLPMSRCIYKVLMGEKITASDVKRIDPTFYEHRVAAVLEEGGVARMEDVLCEELYFVGVSGAADTDKLPAELCPGGRARRVTAENKQEYAELLVEHYLVGVCRRELAVLVEGFYDIIPRKILRGSHGQEGGSEGGVGKLGLRALDLELIVSGMPEIDTVSWKQHTVGSIGEEQHTPLKEWFWAVVESMSVEQRAKLVAYACGCSRLPAGGFAALHPSFRIDVSGEAVENLPSAHTCNNQLVLPKYRSEEELRRKIDKALELDAGFGFL